MSPEEWTERGGDYPLEEGARSGIRDSSLRERASDYFGRGNTSRMKYVHLGRGKCAFVSERRMWIYQEHSGGRRDGVVVHLSEKMRTDLIDAMEGF